MEALNLQASFFGLDQPRASQLLSSAVGTLLFANRAPEAGQLLNQYYIPSDKGWPAREDWYIWRCNTLARQGRWPEAVKDAATALRFHDYPENYHNLATLLVADKDLAGYQQICRELVDHFKGTKDLFQGVAI